MHFYFKLYSNVKLVEGRAKAVLIDLHKKDCFSFTKENVKQLKKLFNVRFKVSEKGYFTNDIILNEIANYLIALDLGFFTSTPELFPELNLERESPFEVTNAIIDLNYYKYSEEDYKNILQQLNNLFCEHIQLRIMEVIPMKFLRELLDFIQKKDFFFKSVSICMINDQVSDFNLLYFDYPRIKELVICNSLKEHLNIDKKNRRYIHYSTIEKFSTKSCGSISEKKFSINIPTFTESTFFNNCLNGKISVDINGEIKNCPSMQESYGNISNSTLGQALNKPNFKKYWALSKDKIHVCKDCEFRYICTDCRAYTDNPKDILSKPLKCGYNPYIGEWSEWSTNPLKQKAIEYYDIKVAKY